MARFKINTDCLENSLSWTISRAFSYNHLHGDRESISFLPLVPIYFPFSKSYFMRDSASIKNRGFSYCWR